MSSNNSRSSGLGLGTVLTIIFVVLKVLNVQPVASWSWIWVLSPLWISFLLSIAVLLIAAVVIGGAKASRRASYRSSGPVRGPRNEREMYARIAERAQNDRFAKSSLPHFDQRNGVR